jgi:hypothetical protein
VLSKRASLNLLKGKSEGGKKGDHIPQFLLKGNYEGGNWAIALPLIFSREIYEGVKQGNWTCLGLLRGNLRMVIG